MADPSSPEGTDQALADPLPAAEEVRRLKGQPGKPLVIYGSAQLASTLMKEGLVDEFQIVVTPVVLGKGKPEFASPDRRYKLEFVKATPFKTGAVMLHYRPKE